MGYWSMVAAGGPGRRCRRRRARSSQAFGWRWIFLAQVPLTLVTLLARGGGAAGRRARRRRRAESVGFDIAGRRHPRHRHDVAAAGRQPRARCGAGPTRSWSPASCWRRSCSSPFVAVERRAAHPLLPLGYLRRRNFSFPMLTQFCTNFAYMGGFVITPLLLQDEFGYDETKTGDAARSPGRSSSPSPGRSPATSRCGSASGRRRCSARRRSPLSMVALASLAPGDTDLVIVGALALSGLGMGGVGAGHGGGDRQRRRRARPRHRRRHPADGQPGRRRRSASRSCRPCRRRGPARSARSPPTATPSSSAAPSPASASSSRCSCGRRPRPARSVPGRRADWTPHRGGESGVG